MPLARRSSGLAGVFQQSFAELSKTAQLQRSLIFWSLVGLLTATGGTAGVVILGSASWLIAVSSLLWWAFVSVFLLGGIAMLVTPEGRRVDYLGIPNGLTAIRAWACYPLFFCASLPLPHNLGLILWCSVGGCVGMLDVFDGLIARRLGPITALGKAFDPAMDVLFFSLAAVGSTLLNILPWWLTTVIVFRYLGPMLATPIVFVLGKRPELVHTKWGRRNTLATGIVFFALMWVKIFSGPTTLAAAVIGLPLLVPTTLLFFRDLLVRLSAAPGRLNDS